jgi:hypothetical protein
MLLYSQGKRHSKGGIIMLLREQINDQFPEFEKKQDKFKSKKKKDKFSFCKDDYEYIISGPAYNDMQPRLLPGIGGKDMPDIWKRNKKGIFEKLADKIESYFNSPEMPHNKEVFDKIHNKMCEEVMDGFIKLGYPNYKYGQAQKLINMAFKYFYCFYNAPDKEKYFWFCHMPIDRYILAWYYRVILDEKKSFDSLPPWSKMDEQTINEIQDNIFKYMSKNPVVKNGKKLTPLEAEFYIWNEEKSLQSKRK